MYKQFELNHFLQTRLKRVQNRLDDDTALVVADQYNIMYLTGIHVLKGWLYIVNDGAIFALDGCSTFESSYIDVVQIKHANNKILPARGKVLIEDGSTYRDVLTLKRLTGHDEEWEISTMILEARAYKDDHEITCIKKAAKICKRVIKKLTERVDGGIVGVSEKQLSRFINAEIFNQGGDASAFNTIVAFGGNASTPHHVPSCKQYKKGEVILCDFGVVKDCYCVDVTRVFNLGTQEKHAAKMVAKVKRDCEKQIVESISFDFLERFSKEKFKELGLEGATIHRLGHGIGMEVHEYPSPSKSLSYIKEGAIFTLEPGIYMDKKFGIRLEDTYLFFSGKLINLTK